MFQFWQKNKYKYRMKISYNWLKDYFKTNATPEELAAILINLGLEVESLERWYSLPGGLEKFVTGEVIECQKHPNADKLSVTKVNIGSDRLLHIVCGAPNVAKGQKVIVATEGAIVYTDQGNFEIKKTKIRGELSEGMICAEDEIGLGSNHDGILVLDPDTPVGIPASEYFNVVSDWVFEIGLTPNRIDSASHYGVARDLAAYLKQHTSVDLVKPDVSNFKPDSQSLHIQVEIHNTDACKRYSGVAIKGVKIKESPKWLKDRLMAIGLRPINNVVDITNYVLHECGQPLHAFDADKIIGKKVIVKTLPEGTKFITLDGVERSLSAEDLMICNEKEGMCMAGVFGGADSGITDSTTNVFLESAYFNPVFIRKTSKRHDLHTDSSFRFERGTDPNGTLYALKRAALLIKEIAGGEIASDIVDVYPQPIEPALVPVTYEGIFNLIGNRLDLTVITNILNALEIEIVNKDNQGMVLKVPTYRVDVKQQADIVEEILRIYGYNNVTISEKVNSTLTYVDKPELIKEQDKISDFLSAQGFHEIMNNSLTKSAYYETSDFYKDRIVYILNPLSSDLNCLRQTLIFGGLESIAFNINRKRNNLKFYEFGNCYFYHKNKNVENKLTQYYEKFMLGLFMTGLVEEPNWNTPKKEVDFYYLKAYVLNIFRKIGIAKDLIHENLLTNHPEIASGLEIKINGQSIAVLGDVKKDLLKQFDIKQDVYVAQIDWDLVMQLIKNRKIQYRELPKYPEVKRDLSMILDMDITYSQLEQIAYKTEPKLIKDINLFDVYQGDKIEKGKKSYAISFTLQSEEKTLTDNEIDSVMKRLMNAYEKQLNAKIRM